MTLTEQLQALGEKATPRPWEVDTLKSEGEYGSGPDTYSGFEVSAIYDAKGEALFDALNSDAIEVHEDYADEDGFVLAYDPVSAANAALIVALVNNLPTILDALKERDARVAEEWDAYMTEAVSKAPEPLRQLGEYLAGLLDEDQWKTAERYLNAAVLARGGGR